MAAIPAGTPPLSRGDMAAALVRFSLGVGRSLAGHREHGRKVLADVATMFEAIGSGSIEPPELVRTIALLERELRWVLDELDRIEEEREDLGLNGGARDTGPPAGRRWR